jgi:hypothetical protein
LNTRAIKDQPIIATVHLGEVETNDNKIEKLAFKKAEVASSITKVQTVIEQLTSELELGKTTLSKEYREAIETKLSLLNDQFDTENKCLKSQDSQVK